MVTLSLISVGLLHCKRSTFQYIGMLQAQNVVLHRTQNVIGIYYLDIYNRVSTRYIPYLILLLHQSRLTRNQNRESKQAHLTSSPADLKSWNKCTNRTKSLLNLLPSPSIPASLPLYTRTELLSPYRFEH